MPAPGDALQLRFRRRLVRVVARYPGLHVRDIARRLDCPVALVEYHLPILRDAGLLRLERDAGRLMAFPARRVEDGLGPRERRWLGALRARRRLAIVLALAEAGGALRHAELGRRTGMSKSLLSFHLGKLEAAGVVRHGPEAIALADAAALSRLLTRFAPVPDVRAEFAGLWSELYGGGGPRTGGGGAGGTGGERDPNR